FTSDDHEALLARSPSAYDGAIPAGSGVAAEVFARLAEHLDDDEMRKARDGVLRALAAPCRRAPSAFATLLAAATYADGPVDEVAIVGAKDDPRTAALLAATRGTYFPARAFAWTAAPIETGLPLLDKKGLLAGAPAAYVCKNRVCAAPVGDPEGLRGQLGVGR